MKLAPQSVPYRAFQKASSLLILVFFVATAGTLGTEVAVGLGAVVVLLSTAYEVAYYRRFEYELTDDTFDIESGVVFRRDREIPYRRIQNVDVSRNVAQRAIGLAAVDLETAGGSETEGALRYVTPGEAERLRREIQRRKADRTARGRDSTAGEGTEDDATDERDELAPEEELFTIAPGELALVGALSFDPRLVGLIVFLASGSVPVLSGLLPSGSAVLVSVFGLFLAALLFVASWLLGAALAIANYYGFRLSRAGDELRYERGLFRRYSGSIPTEKVQTVTIADNPLKRVFDYATLTIETAGYAPGQGGDYGTQAAVPLAKTGRVYELAREVERFADPEFVRPPSRIRIRYTIQYAAMGLLLAGLAYAVDWYFLTELPWWLALGLVPLAPVAGHYKWKHRGFWLGEDHLLTRAGFWSRRTTVVPYYRIQNVIDTRTVFQRRWGVATVVADTAGTSSLVGSDAGAIDIEEADADRLREELGDRLEASLAVRRRSRSRFEWFEADEPDLTD